MHIGIVQINLIKAVYSVAANVYVSCMKPQGSTRHVYGASWNKYDNGLNVKNVCVSSPSGHATKLYLSGEISRHEDV